MDGAELQDLLRTLLPDEVLLEVATATGFHQRDRKRDALTFLRTMCASRPLWTRVSGHCGHVNRAS